MSISKELWELYTMKRHALLRFCSLLLIFCFCCALFACETDEKTELEALYEKYVVSAEASGKTPYSYEEWLTRLASDNLTDAREYTVTFQPNNGEPVFTKTVLHGEAIEFPESPKKSGYVFAGWAVETEESTQLWNSFYAATSDITLTAQWDYFSEELPIINIDTKDVSIDSKEKYTDMTFTLENCDGELSEITGGIRLRGNTTMHYPKKPYRIKFDEKQSLFGLEKAKSWVLLAEYLDPSALHNYTAFSLASELSGLSFTPTPHKVNV